MYKIELIDIKCPECGCNSYFTYDLLYDKEWITVKCECENCKVKYQINYRALGTDVVKRN